MKIKKRITARAILTGERFEKQFEILIYGKGSLYVPEYALRYHGGDRGGI